MSETHHKTKHCGAIEALSPYSFFTALRYRMEDPQSNGPWFNALKALGTPIAPLLSISMRWKRYRT